MFADELAVRCPEVWITPVYSIDGLILAGRQIFVWIKAPASYEQALPAQNFVNSGNAAAKLMLGIEDGGIHICDLLPACE
jgi:hypothetical protein